MRGQAVRLVELILFIIGGIVARLQALLDHHVAGRAGAHAATGVIELDTMLHGDVEDAARQTVIAVGQFLRLDLHGDVHGHERDPVNLRG